MKKAATIIYGVEFLVFLALAIVLACLQGMSELVVVLIVVISVSAFGFLLMLGLMNEHPTGAAIICLVFFDIFGLVPAILLFIENDRLKQERAVALKKENQNKEELANELQEKMLIDQY